MNDSEITPKPQQCCIVNCPAPAVKNETAETSHWHISVGYCDEHARELANGTPLGPVGVDASRLQVWPLGEVEPRVGGRWPAANA